MNISHEVPLALMETSRFFNDYDYALVHLFEKYPDYYKFFEESLNMGRAVYLDNSLYELGKSFDPTKFLGWINRLQPTHYIIPDTFWNADKTIRQAMDWFLNYATRICYKPVSIGVAQGGTYEEIVRSYKFMCSVADMVAFTFKFAPGFVENSGDGFKKTYQTIMNAFSSMHNLNDTNENAVSQAAIRYALLMCLVKDGVVDKTKPHHLLGLQNTAFLENIASDFEWITSIDTSNPVICGLLNKPYDIKMAGNPGGNIFDAKPTKVLADFFEAPINGQQMKCVKDNVQIFNRLVKPEWVDMRSE